MPDQDDSNSSSDDSSDENESTDGGGSNSNGMADQDDAYRRFVHTMTGYVMPNLSEVFDDLKGNSDIPMMRVEISGGSSDMWTTSRSVDDLSELYAKSSNPWFRQENTDVVIPFYSGGSAPGQKVTMKRARITLLGRRSTTDAPDAAGYQNGSEFSSDLKIGDQSSTTWDNRPVAQYVTGSGAALNKVLAGDSFRMGHNDSATVPYADSVKLQSLNDVADSFDRLATFFAGRKKDFDTWGSSLGKETMEWKGQAAGVFHDLIAGLNRIYTSYAKQFATTSAGKSVFGDELRETRETIEEAIREVRDAWSRWHATDGNPLRYVYDELIDTAEHMFNNNIFKVRYHPSTSSGGNYSTYSGGSHKIEDAGFTENAKDGGPLTDMSTWKAIGERAKRKWEATIEEKLVEPARTAEATVSDAFNKIDIPKSVNTVNVSLEAEYGKDVSARDRHEAALEKERMEREREEAETRAREEREEAEARAREEREEAENRMREEREEAENRAREEREEAEAKAEARAEAEKAEAQARYEEQKAEQEAKEEEARAQAEEDRALAEERYERDRADADAQRDEAQAQAERDRAEAQERYDQEKAEAEARADQLLGGGGNFGAMPLDPDAVDRANDLMGGGNPAFMAGMRTPGANLGQGSDDRERRDYDAAQQQQADQQQREAEERYREQQNRADQQQQDAMDRQEQLQREQQARADEIREGADQQRVQTESDYQERQSEAQRDAEARQEEIQREQEARQEEAQARADEQQREAQQRQEEMQREQEARQEEAQARADEQQREAQQRQEEMQREQEAR
ncbi:AAWKG family protein, partial [Streptomyces bohaiensis]